MKKLFTLFAMLTLTVSVMAQTISYQAVLRDTTDGKNELVRNDTGNVVFSVKVYQDGVQTSQKLAPKPFKTNADGMLSLPVDFSDVDGNIDWRNNQITAVFAYGEGYKDTIVLVTPVSAVPYAAQAKDGDLITGVITTYINSTANDEVPDFNLVWNALMANENLTKAMRDSIADYLKDNYKYAKEILYSYMSQVTADDMREAYAQVRNLPQETKDAIDTVLKRYLQKHRDLVIEVAEYYALTATEEEVRTVYNDLKSNGPAAAKIRELLYDYFGRYMKYKGLVCEQTTTGQPANLCDAIAAMNAGGSSTPAPATYDCSTLQVGSVIHVGDVLTVTEGYCDFNSGFSFISQNSPFTLVRANVTPGSHLGEYNAEEATNGEYYLFKDKNGNFYGKYEDNLNVCRVTETSDGLVVTSKNTYSDGASLQVMTHEP